MEEVLRGAEAGKGRLDEVEADERREQQPPQAVAVGERDADEDHGSGHDANRVFHFHVIFQGCNKPRIP